MAYQTVAQVDELPSGKRIVLEVGELWVAVFNVGDKYYALEDRCTHDEGSFEEAEFDSTHVECPRHGARFDFETGKPTLPATSPVPRFAVRVEDGQVQVDLEQQLN